MERVTLSRTVDADPETVRALITDVQQFMDALGLDNVTVDGDRITLQNRMGLFDIELELEVVDAEGAVFAYEQREGVFEAMRTEYTVQKVPAGTEVTATTEFSAVDFAVIGEVLDATIVERQRRKELTAQLDWLERQVEG
jgi:carbon monoxide dehydrogenase subunit G